jgi:hypothetical protein
MVEVGYTTALHSRRGFNGLMGYACIINVTDSSFFGMGKMGKRLYFL